jgi:hypothetical protein
MCCVKTEILNMYISFHNMTLQYAPLTWTEKLHYEELSPLLPFVMELPYHLGYPDQLLLNLQKCKKSTLDKIVQNFTQTKISTQNTVLSSYQYCQWTEVPTEVHNHSFQKPMPPWSLNKLLLSHLKEAWSTTTLVCHSKRLLNFY